MKHFYISLLLLFSLSISTGCQTVQTPPPAAAPAKPVAETKQDIGKTAPSSAPSVAVKPTTAPATAQAKPVSKPADEGLVIVTTSMTSENALPNLASAADLSLWSGLYEYLVYRDAKSGTATIPGIAERWDVSKDFRKFTFYLKKGIQFQDGWGELTADDVKFTFELAMKKGSVNANSTQWASSITSMTTNGSYELTINLNESDWQFIENLNNFPPALPIVSKKYVEKVGEKEANLKPIGSGPYKLVDRRAGDFLKFEAVENHWRKTPDAKWVTIKAVPEAATRIAMLKSGEADIVPISMEAVDDIKKANLRTVSTPGARTYWVVLGSLTLPDNTNFDAARPWWADPADKDKWDRALKVRMAMNLAVNRQEINDALFKGTGTLFSIAPFGVPGQAGGYEDPNRWKPYPFDPTRAKQLLAEAGYPNGFEITMILLKQSGRPEAPKLGEAVAMYWENIGLKVKRQPMDFDTLRPLMYARKLKEAWVFGARYAVEPIVAGYRMSTKDNEYLTGAEYSILEDLAGRGYSEVDTKKRTEIAKEFAQVVYDNYFEVPLVSVNNIWAISNRVADWPIILGDGDDVQQVERITIKR